VAASKPLLDLGEQLGRLAQTLAPGAVESIDVRYYGSDERGADTAGIAALKGVLLAIGLSRVSLVNAAHLARQRGIRVTRSSEDSGAFRESLRVELVAEGKRVRVNGALLGDSRPRIVAIGEHKVDVDPTGVLLVVTNRDVPGVVGKVGTILGSAGVNISDYHQSRPPKKGDEALAAIVVDVRVPVPVLDELRRAPELTGVWQVELGAKS
jgi:D-3-phosphoglycerate dehydrogenase